MKTSTISLLIILGIITSSELHSSLPTLKPVKTIESPGSGKLLADWIDIQIHVIKNTKVLSQHTGQSAYSGIAFYEALVHGSSKYRSLNGQLSDLEGLPLPVDKSIICWQASGNAAIAETFRFFYADNPSSVAKIDSMELACIKMFRSEGFDEASIKAGSDYGKIIAGRIIAWSKTDGSDKSNALYDVPKGDGLWEPTPPLNIPPILPYEGNCRSMVKGSSENTIPPEPVPFSKEVDSPFYQMVKQVYNQSQALDDEKKEIALFWDDFPNGKTVTAGGHWASILKNEIINRNLSLIESASAHTALFITMRDAAIGCFKAKYTYNLMRPVTYIHKYMNDTSWSPLIITPPHPEYPAAHATVSTAAATALTAILGSKQGFTDHTYDYRGDKPRSFRNFIEASREAGMSRYYGGIHYVPSIEAGYIQGHKIGTNVIKGLVFKLED